MTGARDELAGRTVLVVGFGVSGQAAARVLVDAGAEVRVAAPHADDRPEGGRDGDVARGVDFRLGPRAPAELLDGVELVVASPGVAPRTPVLAAALARGLEVWSEPELAWRLADGRTRVVAVTGTNGKTTTTELVAKLLGVPAAGNVGTPLSTVLGAAEPPPLVAAELSSFQLRFTTTLAPAAATVLNLSPDHLDWHGSFVAYGAAKARVWRAQGPGDVVVLPAGDAEAAGLGEAHPPAGRVLTAAAGAGGGAPGVSVEQGTLTWTAEDGRTAPLVRVDELALPGPHNVANAAAAAALAIAAGAEPGALAEPLRAFRPGPHRMREVGRRAGVTWVDDSKATNPHAAAAALASYPSVVWIAGGRNKGLAFDALAPLLGRVRVLATIGESGPELAALGRAGGVEVVEAGTLARAVEVAAAVARPGDTVLLSPACASFDQFRDYAARGDAFARAVAALAKDTAA